MNVRIVLSIHDFDSELNVEYSHSEQHHNIAVTDNVA